MKTAIKNSRSALMAGAVAAVALAAMGFAGGAQARDNVSFSVGIGVPGVQFGVSNAYPVYSQQPVYVQPQVYVQQQPYFVQQAPVYVQPQSLFVRGALGYGGYGGYQPVYYGRPDGGYYREGRGHGHGHGYGHGQGRGHQGGYQSQR